LTVVVTMTRRRCNYDRAFSRPAGHSPGPLRFPLRFLPFPPLLPLPFLSFFFPLYVVSTSRRGVTTDEAREGMTMKSTKTTGGTDRGRPRLTFVAGLTFSNDGIRRVNRKHEMSVRIEMIFANDHNGYHYFSLPDDLWQILISRRLTLGEYFISHIMQRE